MLFFVCARYAVQLLVMHFNYYFHKFAFHSLLHAHDLFAALLQCNLFVFSSGTVFILGGGAGGGPILMSKSLHRYSMATTTITKMIGNFPLIQIQKNLDDQK